MDKKIFYELIRPFLEYYEIKPTPSKLNIYYEKLKHLDSDALKKAFNDMYGNCDDIRTIRFNPVPTIKTYASQYKTDRLKIPDRTEIDTEIIHNEMLKCKEILKTGNNSNEI